MNHLKTTWAALALSLPLTLCLAAPALAQTSPEPAAVAGAAVPDFTDGEIRRIDKTTGKITLRHAEIKHMDMPPMTMVFTVKDKPLLDGLAVGSKVRFIAVTDNGQMIVTDIQPAK